MEPRLLNRVFSAALQLTRSSLVLFLFSLVTSCTSTPIANRSVSPDEPPPITLLPWDTTYLYAYYPDASRRAGETGRIVVLIMIGADGIPEEPITIDEALSTSFPRLLDATRKIFHRRKLVVDDGYRRSIAASVVFEIEPCGLLSHYKDVNIYLNVCIPPLHPIVE